MCDRVFAEPAEAQSCALMEARQTKIASISTIYNTVRLNKFQYDQTGAPIYKNSNFYVQTIGTKKHRAYCVQPENYNGVGYIYRSSEQDYNNIINMYRKTDPVTNLAFGNLYAIRILTFENQVNEIYETYSKSGLLNGLDRKKTTELAQIMAQMAAWYWAGGNADLLFGSGNRNIRDMILSQMACGLYYFPNRVVEKNKNGVVTKDECSFLSNGRILSTEITNYLYMQSEKLIKVYFGINSSYTYAEHSLKEMIESGFFSKSDSYRKYVNGKEYTGEVDKESTFVTVLLADPYYYMSTKAFNDYLADFKAGLRKPTIYEPTETRKDGKPYQKLLADYDCENDSIPESCWNLDVQIPTTCDINDDRYVDSGYVKDVEDWKCVFSSADSDNQTIRDHYNVDVSNNYCNIFCREEVYFELPYSGTFVEQGRFLTVNLTNNQSNNIKPIQYTARKLCRPTSKDAEGVTTGLINYTQFLEDYEKADEAVVSAWENWQQLSANYDACKAQTPNDKENSGKCRSELVYPKAYKTCMDNLDTCEKELDDEWAGYNECINGEKPDDCVKPTKECICP